MSFFCNYTGCEWEFATPLELHRHMQLPHPVEKPLPPPAPKKNEEEVPVSTIAPQPSQPVTSRKPIVASYRYEGDCPLCGRAVDTLYIEIGTKKLILIAYCPPCKKQHEQIEVIPIADQENWDRIIGEYVEVDHETGDHISTTLMSKGKKTTTHK